MKEQRFSGTYLLYQWHFAWVFTFDGSVDVLSVVISLYFLEHYPACLLLAAVHSERRTPVRTFTDEIDLYLPLQAWFRDSQAV
jgi:hypothetical protein